MFGLLQHIDRVEETTRLCISSIGFYQSSSRLTYAYMFKKIEGKKFKND
jgi:hypothetical protein